MYVNHMILLTVINILTGHKQGKNKAFHRNLASSVVSPFASLFSSPFHLLVMCIIEQIEGLKF